MPRVRATSISGLVSAEKVTMPSTSAGVEAGVVEGGGHRLGGQAQLAAARVLGEFGGADAADGGGAGEGVARAARAHDGGLPRCPRRRSGAGATARTVPVTWSPRLLAPRTAISTTPAAVVAPGAVGARRAVTSPVKSMVSPG